jgi:hypothetical protein
VFDSCSACYPGQYGEGCSGVCRCAGGEACDPVTGACPGPCAHGYEGLACQSKSVQVNIENLLKLKIKLMCRVKSHYNQVGQALSVFK